MLRLAREDICKISDVKIKFNAIVFGTYAATSYALSLRGNEGMMLNLSSINKEWDRHDSCIVIALIGKMKGETNARDHVFPYCKITKSCIDSRLWISLLRAAHLSRGRKDGPAITTSEGEILSFSRLDEVLRSYLMRLFRKKHEFPLEIKNEEDIEDRFLAFHSLRRASGARALNQNVTTNDINLVNRWKR